MYDDRDLGERAMHEAILRQDLKDKIQQINDLIDSLPQDQVIWWLAGDGSWGGLPGLGLYLPEQITEDIREQYGIEEDMI